MATIQGCEVKLEAAFGYGPFHASPVWTDITSDLREWSCRRGRQYELDRMETGIAAATLNNRHGNYNTKNTVGAYYPDVKPSVRIRLSAIYDTVTYRLWTGPIERLPLSFPGGADSVVKITAADITKILALAKVTPGFANLVKSKSPRGYWRMTDTTDSSAEGDHTLTLTGSPDTGEAGVWADDEAMQFDGATQYATIADGSNDLDILSDLSIIAWINPDNVATQQTILQRVGASGWPYSLGLQSSFLSFRFLNDQANRVKNVGTITPNEWTFVAITREGDTHLFYINAVLVGTWITDASAIPSEPDDCKIAGPAFFDGHISEIAIWDSALTGSDISELYTAQSDGYVSHRTDERIKAILDDIGFTTYDLETGQTTMASAIVDVGSVLDEIGKATDTESGYVFIAGDGRLKFHDRHYRLLSQGTITATFGPSDLTINDLAAGVDDTILWNDIRITPGDADGQATYVATDAASQSAHGPLTLERTTFPLDETEGFDLAHSLLGRYAEPAQRVGFLTMILGKDTALWPVVLGAELGNRYTIKKTLEGDDLDQDVYLESITHTFTAEKVWIVEWECSPADNEDMFILDSASRGVLDSDVLGY